MSLIRLLGVVSLIITMAGCSFSKTVSHESLDVLEYGALQKDVLSTLENVVPLFKFVSKDKEYFSASFEPSGTYRRYVLVFEEQSLISVLPAGTGREIWEEVYGAYGITVPTIDKFESVISQTVINKLDISETDFSEIDLVKRSEFRQDVGEVVAINILMPFGLIAVVATSPILVPYTLNELNEQERLEESLIQKVNKLSLNSSSNLVKEQLGVPSRINQSSGQEVMVFHEELRRENYLPSCYISMGFVNDRLQWIGYYFNVK